jgi:hypothetical protein
MTADDVVVTMARASFMRNWATDPNGMSEDELFALRKKTDRAVWQMHLANTRAAIRAVTERGGLMVGKMPGDRVVATANSERWQAYYEGHNEALAAVRANAVKVEGV